jgi:F-type H+-transporting ATPase subunit gamma
MPSLKSIRKRITSVKSTQKITRAMKMIAGARLQRAQQRITAMRPYAVKTQQVLQSVGASLSADTEENEQHAGMLTDLAILELHKRVEQNVLVVVITSDRGLCGAFNSNITRTAEREWRNFQSQGKNVKFVTIGRKGRDFLARRQAEILHDYPKVFDGLDLAKAAVIADYIAARYRKGEVDAIYLLYNEFKSAISQKVVLERLLPIPPPESTPQGEYLFEPNPALLLERLVPMYLDISIYRALLESHAAEHGARMTAMDAATRNAKEMIGKLTLQYNRARQAAITKELMEIIGGAEALKD